MKVLNLVNFYKELEHVDGIFSVKLPLNDKAHLISLYEDLNKLLEIFDESQIEEAKEIGVKATKEVLIPEDTEEILKERFLKARENALKEDIEIDFSKYKFSEKIKDIEFEKFTPYFFIKTFITKDLSEL